MRKLNSKFLWVVYMFLLFGFLYYTSNYRLTPIGAAKAHSGVGKNTVSFGEVDFGWSKVYLFNTDNGPRTVISVKLWFLWRAPASSYSDKSTDIVRTVGWMSYSEKQDQAIVFAVETSDPNIAYVEVGPPSERVRKGIMVGTPVIFSWKKGMQLNDFKPVAFSAEGTPLYEYTDKPQTPNVFRLEDLKWYPIKQVFVEGKDD